MLYGKDALSCCLGCCHGGDVRNMLPYSRLTDIAAVVSALLALRSVDDELYLLVDDDILNIGTTLTELVYLFYCEACCMDKLIGLACSYKCEACFS